MRLRHATIDLLWPLVVFVGAIGLPKRELRQKHVEAAYKFLEPGDVILTKTRFEFSNLFIKGHYKHAGIYIGNGEVVEAVLPFVKKTGIFDFLMSKDQAQIVRPKSTPFERCHSAASAAKELVGRPYDNRMFMPKHTNLSNPKFYCSELCYWVHKTANPKLDFDLKTVWGVPTITPDDFRGSESWREILELS